MTLMALRPEPLQGSVLRPMRQDHSTEEWLEKFRQDLFERVSEAPDRRLLSLDYFLANITSNLKLKPDDLNKTYPSWTHNMGEAYREFFEAVDGYVGNGRDQTK